MRENEQETRARGDIANKKKQECQQYQKHIVKKPRVVPLPRNGESNPTLKMLT